MIEIEVEPLSADAFEPYGEVLQVPAERGRLYFNRTLETLSATAKPFLWTSRFEERTHLPLVVSRMERHAFSSQTFIPLAHFEWLVVVAPGGDSPDPSRARAFRPIPGHGVTFAAGTWHHPLTVLSPPAVFAILMWRSEDGTDEEFVEVEPFRIQNPARHS